MTHGAPPSGFNGAEGDSEKKKWGYKRQQFDAAIGNTRFKGAIERLVAGTIEAKTLLAILDELNGGSQKGRYMAEMLALKQESRVLGTVPFSPHVADFLIQGSRRIPLLSEGLASQMAVTLAAAADNLAYLDTVNTAIGNLLFDLDHPLSPDTRNFLRALTDKIDASRRLQQARSQLHTVPSVYPPASIVSLDASPPPPPAESVEAETPGAVEAETPGAPIQPQVAQPVPAMNRTQVMPVGTRTQVMPVVPPPPPPVSAMAPHALEPRVLQSHAPTQYEPSTFGHAEPEPQPVAPPKSDSVPQRKLLEQPSSGKTKRFPWKLVLGLLGVVTLVGVGTGLWLLPSPSDEPGAPSPSASSSAAPRPAETRAAQKPEPRAAQVKPEPRAAQVKPEPRAAPVTAKNAGLSDVRAAEASAKSHPAASRPVEPKPVVVTPPPAPKPVVVTPPETKPASSKPVESPPRVTATDAPVRTPTPVRDIDLILTELRQIPNDVGRIEAKAQEVSRIVSRAVRSEAEKILLRLVPKEVLFGTESQDTRTLEPVRRVVALLLEKVALDKDDTRAAMAIEVLGEWAKSRKHGGAATVTLEQLAEEPVVQSRPRRREALERVRQSLGLSDEETE